MSNEEEQMGCQGRLIVFEGMDGVGKTTIAEAVSAAVTKRMIDNELAAFPGNAPCTLGRVVYDLHHGPLAESMPPTSVQLLHVAAHVDAIENRILPALGAGRWVILDRYWWSTWVYGRVYGVPSAALRGMLAVEMEHWGATLPTIVFLVDRAQARRTSDRVQLALHEQYERIAERESGRVRVCRLVNERSVTWAVGEVLRELFGDVANHGARKPRAAKAGKRAHPQQPASGALLVSGVEAPYVCTSIAPAKPTAVYDTYWRFAAERQRVFFRRLHRQRAPWTQDAILQQYKFTNAYRASDRVSQFLIRRVIYECEQDPREIFFGILLFKTFNRIETWERLQHALDRVTYSGYSYRVYNRLLQHARTAGQRLYSAAYIMPSGKMAFGHERKHQNHLRLIEKMIEDRVPERLTEMRRMSDAFQLLRSYPMIGDFLAYQYVTDLNYSTLTDFTEMEFVVPGPGARDGIRKCFVDLGGLNEPEIIRFMADRQEPEFERLGIDFPSLWGRPLQLIDCQNLFCEVDKYARVAHPDVTGRSGRTRIKQRFRENPDPIEYWYPPKWGLNERVAQDLASAHDHV